MSTPPPSAPFLLSLTLSHMKVWSADHVLNIVLKWGDFFEFQDIDINTRKMRIALLPLFFCFKLKKDYEGIWHLYLMYMITFSW